MANVQFFSDLSPAEMWEAIESTCAAIAEREHRGFNTDPSRVIGNILSKIADAQDASGNELAGLIVDSHGMLYLALPTKGMCYEGTLNTLEAFGPTGVAFDLGLHYKQTGRTYTTQDNGWDYLV
jgi:hypothetical protein